MTTNVDQRNIFLQNVRQGEMMKNNRRKRLNIPSLMIKMLKKERYFLMTKKKTRKKNQYKQMTLTNKIKNIDIYIYN